ALLLEALVPLLVKGRPQPAWTPGRHPLHQASVVGPAVDTVDPPETKSLFDQVVVHRAFEVTRLLAVDHPYALSAVLLSGEPAPPSRAVDRNDNLFAVWRLGLG